MLLSLCAACTAPRRALYAEAARWLAAHALPSDQVAVPAEATGAFKSDRVVAAPSEAGTFAVMQKLAATRPEYVLVADSVVWEGVRAQPWFRERYRRVHAWSSPSVAGAPLMLYAHTPSPFDGGARHVVDGVFVDALFALRGYRLALREMHHGRHIITPGAPLRLTLYWAEEEAGALAAMIVTVQLADATTGAVLAQVSAPPELAYPLGDHREGRTRHTLPLPDDLPAGTYTLRLALAPQDVPAQSAPAIDAPGRPTTWLTLAEVTHLPDVSAEPLPVEYPAAFELGEAVALVGYDAPERVAPGAQVSVALLWHVLDEITADLKVFVHLRTSDDAVVAQSDAKPVAWRYPTPQWQPGEYIRDVHVLSLPANLPRGDYRLVIGMYDAANGERLAIRDDPVGEIHLHLLGVR